MSVIEKTLLSETGTKPQKKGEDRQKFLARVIAGVGKLSDDEWEKLAKTDGAQDWYNAATEADNAEKAIPDFPDAKATVDEDEAADDDADDGAEDEEDEAADDAADDQEEDADEEEDVAPKKTSSAKDGKKKPVPAKKEAPVKKSVKEAATPKKGAAAKKPAAAAPKKGTSMRRTLKMIIVKKPKMSVEDLIEALGKKGHTSPSKLTVSSIRSDTRDTMKVLVEAGILDVEV